jgi:hypothetical protein
MFTAYVATKGGNSKYPKTLRLAVCGRKITGITPYCRSLRVTFLTTAATQLGLLGYKLADDM